MKYLADTHVCFWSVFQKGKLSSDAKIIVENEANEIFVSPVSLWEIAIKYKLGKFPDFTVDLDDFVASLEKTGFAFLPLKNDHLTAYFNCPFFHPDHKDPFDRLLIATADFEKASFITKDEKFDAYKDIVNVVW